MTAIFKREFRSFFHGMLGVRPYGVSGGELRPVFPGPVPDLWPDGFQLLHPLPDYFHAAALYPGAGDALTGRGAPQPHDQLLLTSPVSVWGIVLGKFFAMAAVFALPCAWMR